MPRNEFLRQKRIQQNWRQQDLADHIGTTVVSVRRWERGTHQPSLYYRTKLCALFALSPQELGFVDETSSLPTSVETPHAMSEASLPTPFERSSQQTRIWTVPYARNPLFTGREDLLACLDQQFASSSSPTSQQPLRQAALTQAQVINGLGGIGKTQIAIEYAYRCLQEERYTHTCWISAVSEETILTSFAELASLIPDLHQQHEQDERKLAKLVIRWLEGRDEPWLIVFDNADTIERAAPYFPTRGHGALLLTTRASAVGAQISSIEVETMGIVEGTQLLLRRAHRMEQVSDNTINEASNIVIVLGQFPLAIDQAGAYLEETQCSLQDYLQIYYQHQSRLLARRGRQEGSYPDSVATTWSLSFDRVEQTNPAAAELLRLCAFVAPDHLPEELLTAGKPYWPASLQEAVSDRLHFNQMLETVLAFSLLKRVGEDHQLSLHRLVQVVQRSRMTSDEQRQWAERLVLAVHTLLPANAGIEMSTWPQCQRLLEQAQMCDVLVQQYGFQQAEVVALLERTGIYLRERGVFSPAELLLLRALRIQEQRGNSEDIQTAELQLNLAFLYALQGRYKEAEILCLQALSIRQQQLGPEHLDVAHALSWLATIVGKQGKLAYSEQLHLQALNIRQRQLQPEHPLVAMSLYYVGEVYTLQKKYAQAEVFLLQSVRIREQHLGPEHLSTAAAISMLATIYFHQRKYEEAESLYLQAIRVQEHHLGSEHLRIAYSLCGIAEVYAQQGKDDQAELLFLRAIRIREHHLGLEHRDVAYPLHGLANLYARQEKSDQAELLYQRALRLWEPSLESEDPGGGDVLYDVARFWQTQDRLSEAASLYQHALVIRETHLGIDHALTIETQTNLRSVLLELGRTEATALEHIPTAPDDHDSVPPAHAYWECNSDVQRNHF